MNTRNVVLWGLIVTTISCLLLALTIWIVGPDHMPHGARSWYNIALVAVITELLALRVWFMVNFTDKFTQLGVSTIITEFFFSLVWLLLLLTSFWPGHVAKAYTYTKGGEPIIFSWFDVLGVFIGLACIWSIIVLLRANKGAEIRSWRLRRLSNDTIA